MYTARFSLTISRDDLLAYYRREKNLVRVETFEGYTIQFRADHLRPWVTRDGVSGIFEIHFDSARRFVSLNQVKVHRNSGEPALPRRKRGGINFRV